jgi:hypothetical protein
LFEVIPVTEPLPPPVTENPQPSAKKKFSWPTIRQMKHIFLLDIPRIQSGSVENVATVAPIMPDISKNADNNNDDIQNHQHTEPSHEGGGEESKEEDEAVPDGWAGQIKVVLRRESSASDLREKAFFQKNCIYV